MHEGVCPSCAGTEICAARNGVDSGECGAVGLRPHLELGFRGAAAVHHEPAGMEFAKQNCVRVTKAT